MKVQYTCLAALVLALNTATSFAATLYVDVNSSSPTPPYADWTTAAATIQDAINAATDGDRIVVTNGLYQTGAVTVHGDPTRVAIAKVVTVESVNGPGVTIIDGGGASRCAYLTFGAKMSGFALTNGLSSGGSGVWCESHSSVVSNCVVTGNHGTLQAAGAYGGTLRSCLISNNTANTVGTYGGGAYNCALNDCTIIQNFANVGGGAYFCELTNCLVTGNSAGNLGGGTASCTADSCILSSNSGGVGGAAYFGTFTHCIFSNNTAPLDMGGATHGAIQFDCFFTGNSANLGGATSFGTVDSCLIVSNSASAGGGAAYQSTVTNCTLIGNTASTGGGTYNSTVRNCILRNNTGTNGGGASGGSLANCLLVGNSAARGGACYMLSGLANCTIASNSASITGGGVNGNGVGSMTNCIVYHNAAPAGTNYSSIKLSYCCTTPILTNDVTSFTNEPLFIDEAGGDFHLQPGSPCINAGKNSPVTGSADLEHNPRVAGATVDIGAYEFQSPTSVISYAWLTQYGLPLDGSADFLDPDGDGLNNWAEWRAGTNPNTGASVLRMLPLVGHAPTVTVRWEGVITRSYRVHRGTNLTSTMITIATNLPGVAGTNSYMDSSAPTTGPSFYRVSIQE